MWRIYLDYGNIAMFALFIGEENFNPLIQEAIRSHLQAIQMSIKHYFTDLN